MECCTEKRLTALTLNAKFTLQAAVAQLVEQPIRNRQVDGSSPPRGSSVPTVRPGDMGYTTYLRHR